MTRALLIAAAVLVTDQLTKAWIVVNYPLGWEQQVIPGLFRLVHTRNRGVAFGLLGSSGPVVQIGLLVLIVAVVAFIIWQLARGGTDGLTRIALALVLGGAVGNLVDRVLRGEVVDFLLFYVMKGGRELQWPAFNVADSAISTGACLVILAEIITATRSKRVPVDS
ncbi:MAG: signal peptidase II [Thermoanaerobaculaceae bacterium]|jgi:signal peptidase II|nr:signal peptidase II [Thermoanaerobaculaceae bacterium]